jgi:hypothetical protein
VEKELLLRLLLMRAVTVCIVVGWLVTVCVSVCVAALWGSDEGSEGRGVRTQERNKNAKHKPPIQAKTKHYLLLFPFLVFFKECTSSNISTAPHASLLLLCSH